MFQLLKTSLVEQAVTLHCYLSSKFLIFSSVTSNLLLIPSEIKQKKTGGEINKGTVSFRTTVIKLIHVWLASPNGEGREREEAISIGRNCNSAIKFPEFEKNYKTYIDLSSSTPSKHKKHLKNLCSNCLKLIIKKNFKYWEAKRYIQKNKDRTVSNNNHMVFIFQFVNMAYHTIDLQILKNPCFLA